MTRKMYRCFRDNTMINVPYNQNEEEEERSPFQPDPSTDDPLKHSSQLSSEVQRILFETRTLLIFGEITIQLAQTLCAQMLALEYKNKEPIRILINSPGGHVEAGDTIHDMIKFIRPTIYMLGTGWVASAGVHIFLAAQRNNRYCLANTRFMIHQPLGGIGGPASDIAIEAREIIKVRNRLNHLIAQETNTSLEQVEKDTDRNYWMTAEEAQNYGLVSHIIHRQDDFIPCKPRQKK